MHFSVKALHNFGKELYDSHTYTLANCNQTRKCFIESSTPNTSSSQIITTITTTAFRILLIVCCIGMYLLINQRITPATTSTIRIVSMGIKMILI